MRTSVATVELETEGIEVPSSCQPDSADAVRCWADAVKAGGIDDDKVIAIECGMTASHYSKVASGSQGSLIALAYRLPPNLVGIRHDFFRRLGELVETDPVEDAIEQAMVANLRVLRLMRRRQQLPARAVHMAPARA